MEWFQVVAGAPDAQRDERKTAQFETGDVRAVDDVLAFGFSLCRYQGTRFSRAER